MDRAERLYGDFWVSRKPPLLIHKLDSHMFCRFGSQIGTTMIYTYATDSYKPQSGEIGAIINLFKSGRQRPSHTFIRS